MIRITALMDDKQGKNEALVCEHGLSFYVEAKEKRFLFDCGQSPLTWQNAAALELNVNHLDAVILSHSHYDHAGGYRSLVENGGGSQVLYTGDGFWEEKFSMDGTSFLTKSAGFDGAFLRNRGIEHRVVEETAEIAPGVYLIGNFPRVHTFETIPEKFVRKTGSGFIWDDFKDEICMALDVGGALAVLAGCSHPGILNMVQHVRDVLGMPVYAVYGGTHLIEATEGRIDATLSALQDMGLKIFGLSHCSGTAVEAAISRNPQLQGCHMTAGDAVVLK